MTLYAVAYLNTYDNELTIEFVYADSLKDAVLKHSAFADDDMREWGEQAPEDLEGLKNHFFDGDAALDVQAVPMAGGGSN